MYVIKNKQTGFKLYLNEEQWIRFYRTTGSKLIKSGKTFSNLYSIKKIKTYDLDKLYSKIFNEDTFYFLVCIALMTILTFAFIYFAGK